MDNHFHLLVRMLPENDFSDDEIKKRYVAHFGDGKELFDGQLPYWRQKLSSLSEFMRDIKVGFARYFNKRHNRRGYFWGDRFKSLVVENGETLINCLAYIDLNPVRAGIVKRPEDYRWSSIGYHVQSENKDKLLSLDFGLKEFRVLSLKDRLRKYRRFLYEAGAIERGKGATINKGTVASERKKEFNLSRTHRFLYRTRYFTDSGIIGSKEYIRTTYRMVKSIFNAKRDKVPKPIRGLDGIYSLKRLAE